MDENDTNPTGWSGRAEDSLRIIEDYLNEDDERDQGLTPPASSETNIQPQVENQEVPKEVPTPNLSLIHI